MRVMSISDFADWHRRHTPSAYTYSSLNQNDPCRYPARVLMRFSLMTSDPAIHQIAFRNEADSISFNQVKEVRMNHSGKHTHRAFIDIICEGEGNIFRLLID